MIRIPRGRTAWLLGAAGLLVAANVADRLFLGEETAAPRKRASAAAIAPPEAAAPAAAAAARDKSAEPPRLARVDPARSPEEMRRRIEQMRSLAHASRELNEAYARVALPYAETMAPLATWFPPGSDPKGVLERAVRQLAADSGVQIDGLVVRTPQRIGEGLYRGVATVTLRAADSGGMLRFLSEAGRPGGGMVWNGFQLTADAQKKSLALAGELHVLLVEAAE